MSQPGTSSRGKTIEWFLQRYRLVVVIVVVVVVVIVVVVLVVVVVVVVLVVLGVGPLLLYKPNKWWEGKGAGWGRVVECGGRRHIKKK